MPVEIKELIIQANVDEKDQAANFKTVRPPETGNQSLNSKGAGGNLPMSSLKKLVREMVEEALRKKGYR